MRKGNIFKNVGSLSPSRSVFDLSYEKIYLRYGTVDPGSV